MKRLISVLLWAAFAGASASAVARAAPSGAPAAETEEPGTWLYAQGLSCPLCAHNLEAQLKRIPGVARVKIDLAAGRAGVWFAPGKEPTSARLERAVKDSGFTFIREDRR